MRSPSTYRRLSAGLLLVVAVALVLGVRLFQVHDQTWEWRLQPSATPPKVRFENRDYRRESGQPLAAPAAGAAEVGTTSAGTPLYAVSNGTHAPTGVYARAQRGFVSYSLMGGP
jgi:hypothetical protein